MPKLKPTREIFPPEERTILLAVMISEKLNKEIKQVAKSNGVNRSQAVRWMIHKAMKKPTMINLTLQ